MKAIKSSQLSYEEPSVAEVLEQVEALPQAELSMASEAKLQDDFAEISIDGDKHLEFMHLALEQARIAYARGEVPIGAVVARAGRVVAAAYNEREATSDPTAHAEVVALRRAGSVLSRWNLYDCDLYVTIEPCAMCSGAIINSRIRTVYYGATDPRFGCGGSLMNLITDPRFNHRAEVVSGICEGEARELMQSFFRERRLK